jgi:hypothetical protein
MTDSFGNQGEAAKLRLFSKFLQESFSEQSENSHEGSDIETVRVGDVYYTLFCGGDDEGPSLLLEVEDVEGFRYFISRWRIPLDTLAEESLSDNPIAGLGQPIGLVWFSEEDLSSSDDFS